MWNFDIGAHDSVHAHLSQRQHTVLSQRPILQTRNRQENFFALKAEHVELPSHHRSWNNRRLLTEQGLPQKIRKGGYQCSHQYDGGSTSDLLRLQNKSNYVVVRYRPHKSEQHEVADLLVFEQ
eukprot:Lithocolla_globosa_v1_NODE_47_length_7891_cov_8.351582.p5 type:complete len:123 gc:universal NODE_47_length_7891_cov_8.351582:377-9(-)